LLHFVAFFRVASLFSTGVDNKKVGVDNEKALELTNSTVFHIGEKVYFGDVNKLFVDNAQQCFVFTPQTNFPVHNLDFH
jgi:hypothetical protein